jgi:eukaryotic-like serine/threonine-protein kinase
MSTWTVPGFTEERELGRGASGRVVSAVHDASGRQVAVKYLAPRLFGDPRFLDGFRQEAEVLRSLDVPQVVRLFDYVEAPGEGAAIVMELVNGVSLHQMITRQGSTSPESALVVLKGSLLGLASAHQLGIVHRDYKPENVLVDDAGNSKLTDFGIAVKAGRKAPAAGTPLYMAPEQWNGAEATPATDIYAATAVFFECLTGKTPFSGRPGQLAMQHETAAVPVALVDEPLQELIERGMAKDPRDRPPNAMEFVAELNWVADQAYGPDWEERGRGDLARRSAALLLLLLGGVAGAAGGSFTVTLLAAINRRKKAVIAGVAVGIFAAIAATTTVYALQGNNGTPAASAAGSTGPGSSGSGTTSTAVKHPGRHQHISDRITNGPPHRQANENQAGSHPDDDEPGGQPANHDPANHQPATDYPATDDPATAAGHLRVGDQPQPGFGDVPGHAAGNDRERHDLLQPGNEGDLPLGALQRDQLGVGHGDRARRRERRRLGLGESRVEQLGDRRHAHGDLAVRPFRNSQGRRPVLVSHAVGLEFPEFRKGVGHRGPHQPGYGLGLGRQRLLQVLAVRPELAEHHPFRLLRHRQRHPPKQQLDGLFQ